MKKNYIAPKLYQISIDDVDIMAGSGILEEAVTDGFDAKGSTAFWNIDDSDDDDDDVIMGYENYGVKF